MSRPQPAEREDPPPIMEAAPVRKSSNLALRVLTAVIAAPLVIGLMYVGGWPFIVVLTAAAVGAQYELYGLARQGGIRPRMAFGLVIGALLVLRAALPVALPLSFALLLVMLAAEPFRHDEQPLPALAVTVLGAVYPAACIGLIGDLRLTGSIGPLDAFYVTLAVFLLVWATDTFAYFAGRAMGKHPLALRVSPKKTWEGAVGGAVGAVLIAIILELTLLSSVLTWIDALIVALICGIVSQLGDLAESKLKRSVGAKDSGNILPGHGGLLDRLDALILAAPLVYLYLRFVAGIY